MTKAACTDIGSTDAEDPETIAALPYQVQGLWFAVMHLPAILAPATAEIG